MDNHPNGLWRRDRGFMINLMNHWPLYSFFSGGAIGDCITDTFSISAPGNRGSPVICGTNTNGHGKMSCSAISILKLTSSRHNDMSVVPIGLHLTDTETHTDTDFDNYTECFPTKSHGRGFADLQHRALQLRSGHFQPSVRHQGDSWFISISPGLALGLIFEFRLSFW